MDEKEVIFSTSLNEAVGSEMILSGNPASMVCTNIEEIMGGRVKIWDGGKRRTALKDTTGRKVRHPSFHEEMSHHDGKIEFCTYESVVHLALGVTSRLVSEQGPFVISFKERDFETFLNIDGEYF